MDRTRRAARLLRGPGRQRTLRGVATGVLVAVLLGVTTIATSAIGFGAGDPASARTSESSICDRFLDAEVAVVGEVGDPELDEISGLAASRRHPGVLWAHNDSGDGPRVFALDEEGQRLGAFALEGAEHVDWEDMAVGPGPDGDPHLFVGDIGQNIALREPAIVYRTHEPDARPEGDGVLAEVDRLELLYPDGPADAETLLVDPDSGDLVIVTKALDGRSRILTAPADALRPDTSIEMIEAGMITFTDPGRVDGSPLPGTMLTGGDIAPDGSFIVLRTYKELLVLPRDGSIVDTLTGEPCARIVENEPQGEAVAVTADGTALITISEFGLTPDPPVPVHRFDLGASDTASDPDDIEMGSPPETETESGADAEPRPESTSRQDEAETPSSPMDSPSRTAPVLVAVGALGAVVLIVVVILRSRRS